MTFSGVLPKRRFTKSAANARVFSGALPKAPLMLCDQDILWHVRNREYPEQATENDRRTLRRLAWEYVLDRDILYKRRKDQVLLRCVDAVEARQILEEVHEGVCGAYANGFTMARQIMRFGYYWSTMEGDCISYAKKCHKC
ncbi:hypothetical protein CXB51_024177 [Gossypium anomalum]|uniref:Integrase zinc-binding domain-containing protein n=1 Tax=Gossypium anomalum TaxID=47600 RepID=A0A8J6CS74_9ROSI|nr:hypothetical protein CXB51_024177 [Gossypium anomalum]